MKKNVPQVLLDLFRANAGKQAFKMLREGDPILIPQSELPALLISENETAYDLGPTGFDNVVHTITIQVVFNKKDDFGSPVEGSSLDATIDAVVQGRDEITGEFVANSIMGILRKNISLGNLVIESIGKVRKGIIPRSDELTTQEAHIDLTITELQQISGRV